MQNFVITTVGKEPIIVTEDKVSKEYGNILSPVIMNMPIVTEAVLIKDGFTTTIRKVTGDV